MDDSPLCVWGLANMDGADPLFCMPITDPIWTGSVWVCCEDESIWTIRLCGVRYLANMDGPDPLCLLLFAQI